MKYFVYSLKSLTKNYIYVGMTNNLERRINQHNKGYSQTTKPYAPFKIIRTESFPDRKTARERERYLKSGTGKEFLKNL